MTRDAEKTTPFVKDDKQPTRGGQGSQGKKSGQKPPGDQPAKAVHAVGHMFSNFEAAKNRKLPKWAAPLLTAMLLFHVVLFMTMWVKTIWDIEQLDRPKNSVDLASRRHHPRRRRRPRVRRSRRTSRSRRRRSG